MHEDFLHKSCALMAGQLHQFQPRSLATGIYRSGLFQLQFRHQRVWQVRGVAQGDTAPLRDAVGARSAKRHHLQWHDRSLQVLVAQGSAAS